MSVDPERLSEAAAFVAELNRLCADRGYILNSHMPMSVEARKPDRTDVQWMLSGRPTASPPDFSQLLQVRVSKDGHYIFEAVDG